jgi:hypothetical protein
LGTSEIIAPNTARASQGRRIFASSDLCTGDIQFGAFHVTYTLDAVAAAQDCTRAATIYVGGEIIALKTTQSKDEDNLEFFNLGSCTLYLAGFLKYVPNGGPY